MEDVFNLRKPKIEVPLPEEKFEDFYKEFEFVHEIEETKEWKEIYSNYFNFDKYQKNIKIHETEKEIESYTPEQQLTEFVKCSNSFSYFAHKYIKILHPIRGLIPFMMYRYQQEKVITALESNRFNIVSKFRQGGLTTVAIVWGIWRGLFKTDQQILLMSKTDREAITAGGVAKIALENLPSWLAPEMGKNNDHEKYFESTGSKLMFYSPEAARGKAITLLIIDEAAFIPDMHKHWKSIYPVISTGGACVVISTVNGLGNWYEETYHEAEAGKNKFNVIDLDYWEHPDYNDPVWIEDNKANLGEKGWLQEIERSFLGSGETYIKSYIIGELDKFTRDNMPERVAFPKWANRLENKTGWDKGALWIWKESIDGHEYIIAVDCADGIGEEGDNSAFEVLDANTMEQVAEFYSNNVPPHIYAQILNEIGYYYNNALLVVENIGPGSAVLQTLGLDLGYPNIYHEEIGKTPSPGIKPGKNKRPLYLQTLQHRLTNNTVKINSRRIVTELRTFIYNQVSKRAESQKGKHDDAIIALSMALHIRDTQMRNIPIGSEVPKEMLQVFKTELYEEIRREILEGSPKDWLADEIIEENYHMEEDEILGGLNFNIRRRHDKLLKEFGW